MEDNYYLQECGDDDVLSFRDVTFKVSKFKTAVNQSFNSRMGSQLSNELNSQEVRINHAVSPSGNSYEYAKWFNEGIDCEILNLGSKSWKKGKVRIKVSLEFYVEQQEAEQTGSNNQPELPQPESPLDDLRQLLNQDSQPQNS